MSSTFFYFNVFVFAIFVLFALFRAVAFSDKLPDSDRLPNMMVNSHYNMNWVKLIWLFL